MSHTVESLRRLSFVAGPNKDEGVTGRELLAGLTGILDDANVLDVLMANPDFVPDAWKDCPEEWRGRFGDITPIYYVNCYHPDSDGIQCIFWNGVEWKRHSLDPGSVWDVGHRGLILEV